MKTVRNRTGLGPQQVHSLHSSVLPGGTSPTTGSSTSLLCRWGCSPARGGWGGHGGLDPWWPRTSHPLQPPSPSSVLLRQAPTTQPCSPGPSPNTTSLSSLPASTTVGSRVPGSGMPLVSSDMAHISLGVFLL